MKLIASNISNLTDARFFAAYMPELLVMPEAGGNNLLELMLWYEQVKPWIEGPQWAIAISEETTAQDLQNIIDHGIQTVVYDGRLNNFPAPPIVNLYLKKSILEIDEIKQIRYPYQGIILLDCPDFDCVPAFIGSEVYIHLSAQESIPEIIPNDKRISGIAVDGGAEEKVGFKSYEQWIDLFENLL